VSVTALPSHVQELADRVATGHGVEVLELTLRGQGRGRVLSVVLDGDEPVEADVVEQVSKDLSRALDQADPVPGSYTLEVSTPGLSRPLQTARDFRRQRGHEVSIVRGAGPDARDAGDGPEQGRGPLRGVVVDADDEAVVLDVDGDQVQVPLSEVVRGKVVLPW
jgi:ribosome maturation factor RimP